MTLTQHRYENVDELVAHIMETGDVDALEEGIFGDMFKKAAGKAVGFVRQAVGGGGRRQRQIGATATYMGPKMLGPGPQMRQLSGGVQTSKNPASAYAASRMLPAVGAKTNPAAHPVLKELNDRSYEPVGEYHHPEGGHFSVWMHHPDRHTRSGRSYSSGPDDSGGQVHVEHDGNTGVPSGNWHYFHDPESHSSNSGWNRGNHNRERFDEHPNDHGKLEHPENVSDYDNHAGVSELSSWAKSNQNPHHQSANALGNLLDTVDETKPDNAHHGGRYQSDEESTLSRHGWRHYEDDNHNTHEKYDFISDPVSKYTNDRKYPDHEIHLSASGGWKHFAPDVREPVATHQDGDLSHHLKYGIKDVLGASIHDQHDQENDFPDHPHPQFNMGSGHHGYEGNEKHFGDHDEEEEDED